MRERCTESKTFSVEKKISTRRGSRQIGKGRGKKIREKRRKKYFGHRETEREERERERTNGVDMVRKIEGVRYLDKGITREDRKTTDKRGIFGCVFEKFGCNQKNSEYLTPTDE